MSTSAIDKRSRAAQTAFRYLIVSIACAAVGAIYEMFSHEVYSYFMLYAFMIPLVGGALPFLSMTLGRRCRCPQRVWRTVYHMGIATLTTGCFVRGILDIYGTTNGLVSVYWYVGCALVMVGFVGFVMWDRLAFSDR